MASKFSITAELSLQTKNLTQVVNNLKQQFQGANLNIKLKDLSTAQQRISGLNRSAKDADRSFKSLGNSIGSAAKRFGAMALATGTFVGLARAIKNSVGEAIEFEREMVKISQAAGRSVASLKSLQNEIGEVASTLGVSSKELVGATRNLVQAGFAANKVKDALKLLAQTELSGTFDSIADTTEGVIALLNQFGQQAQKTGTEIDFLEKSLSAISQVSKDFAVESGDLVTAIRTTGSAFQSAGGDLNELIALFTSVRATTRESAESIATGFRTIFTRVQRVDTINALRNIGVELQDAEGKFVGPMEAAKRLAVALKTIDPKDFRFNLVVEELGGFRQVSKVIPLIQQFTVAQKALGVAQQSSGTLAKDAQSAQQALAVQIQKTKEEFQSFIREVVGSDAFKEGVTGALQLASAFIKVADALRPVLPLITSFAAIKIGSAFLPSIGSFLGKKRAGGGPIGFASGGFVPGHGNGDTVPAMLTPGEFVIRKSSVQKLGADNLARMNKYASGGPIKDLKSNIKLGSLYDLKTGYDKYQNAKVIRKDLPKSYSEIRKLAIDTTQKISNEKFNFPETITKENGQQVDDTIAKIASIIKKQVGSQTDIVLNKSLFYNKDGRLAKDQKNKLKAFSLTENAKGELSQSGGIVNFIQGKIGETLHESGHDKTKGRLTKLKDKFAMDYKITNKNGQVVDLEEVKVLSKDISDDIIIGKALKYYAEEHVKNSGSNYKNNSKDTIDIGNISFISAIKKKNLGGMIQKFALGGPAGKSPAARAITIPRPADYTFDKPAGVDLEAKNSKGQMYKLNAEDRLDYIREDVNVDVNTLKNVSKGLLERYREEKRPDYRGYRFEDILMESGLAKSRSKLSNARLDGITPEGNPFEAKSTLQALNIADFEDKLYGAISDNISEPEQLLRNRFNSSKLTDGQDNINVGKVTVFQDVTSGLGSAVKAKARMGYQEEEAAKQAKKAGEKSESLAEDRLKKIVDQNFNSGYKILNYQYGPISAKGLHRDVSTMLNEQLGGRYQDIIGNMSDNQVISALEKFILKEKPKEKASGGRIARFATGGHVSGSLTDIPWMASGGAIGTDTVPAMLTPGEYVINRKSAEKIGYSNLHRMNTVGRFATGGIVGMANGGMFDPKQQRAAQQTFAQTTLSTAIQKGTITHGQSNAIIGIIENAIRKGFDAEAVMKNISRQLNKATGQIKLDKAFQEKIEKAATRGGTLQPKQNNIKNQVQQQEKLSDKLKEIADQSSNTGTKFLVLAGITESVVAQFTGLSDETKAAATAFGATASVYKGVGDSLKNFGLDLITSSIKRREEKLALTQSAQAAKNHAQTVNAAAAQVKAGAVAGGASSPTAPNKAGAGLEKMTTALGLVDAAITGFSVAMGAAAAQAAYYAEISEKSTKKMDETIDMLSKDASKVSIGKLTTDISQAVSDKNKSLLMNKVGTTAGVGTGVLGGLATGAAVGSFGGPIGTIIGGTIGAITGGLTAVFLETTAAQQKHKEMVDLLNSASSNLASSMKIASDETQSLAKFMADVAKKTDVEVVNRSNQALENFILASNKATEAEVTFVKTSGSVKKAYEDNKEVIDKTRQPLDGLRKDFEGIQAEKVNRFIQELGKKTGTKEFTGKEIDAFLKGEMGNIKKYTEALLNQQYKPQITEFEQGAKNLTGEAAAKSKLSAEQMQTRINEIAALQLKQSFQELAKTLQESQVQIIEQKLAIEEEKQTREKLIGTMASQIAFKGLIENIQYSTKKFSDEVANAGAVFNNSITEFASNIPNPEVLKLSTPTGENRIDFDAALKSIGNLGGEAGKNISKQLSQFVDIMPQLEAGLPTKNNIKKGMSEAAIDKFMETLKLDQGTEVYKIIKEKIRLQAGPAGIQQRAGLPGMSPEELGKNVLGQLKSVYDDLKQAGSDLLETFRTNEDQMKRAYSLIVESRKREVDIQLKSVEKTEELAKNITSALGINLNLNQKNAMRAKRQELLAGGAGGDPAKIFNELQKVQEEIAKNLKSEAKTPDQINAVAKKNSELVLKADKLKQALTELSDQSARTADTLSEIEKFKAQRETFRDFAKNYLFGTTEEKSRTEATLQATNIAMMTGDIESIPDQLKSGVSGLLDQFKDVKAFGGLTGKQVQNQLLANKMAQMGNVEGAKMILKDLSSTEQKLIKELKVIFLNEEISRINTLLLQIDHEQKLIDAIDGNTAAMKAAQTVAEEKLKNLAGAGGEKNVAPFEELEKQREGFIKNLKNINQELEGIPQKIAQIKGQIDAVVKESIEAIETAKAKAKAKEDFEEKRNKMDVSGHAAGGLIYRAVGGDVKNHPGGPRGTDTVPAWLTEGEYVIRKSTVDRIGKNTLDKINSGEFFAKGGLAGYYQFGGRGAKLGGLGLNLDKLREKNNTIEIPSPKNYDSKEELQRRITELQNELDLRKKENLLEDLSFQGSAFVRTPVKMSSKVNARRNAIAKNPDVDPDLWSSNRILRYKARANRRKKEMESTPPVKPPVPPVDTPPVPPVVPPPVKPRVPKPPIFFGADEMRRKRGEDKFDLQAEIQRKIEEGKAEDERRRQEALSSLVGPQKKKPKQLSEQDQNKLNALVERYNEFRDVKLSLNQILEKSGYSNFENTSSMYSNKVFLLEQLIKNQDTQSLADFKALSEKGRRSKLSDYGSAAASPYSIETQKALENTKSIIQKADELTERRSGKPVGKNYKSLEDVPVLSADQVGESVTPNQLRQIQQQANAPIFELAGTSAITGNLPLTRMYTANKLGSNLKNQYEGSSPLSTYLNVEGKLKGKEFIKENMFPSSNISPEAYGKMYGPRMGPPNPEQIENRRKDFGYRADGGMINFNRQNENLSAANKKSENPFSTFDKMMMTHKLNVDGALNVGGIDSKAIAENITNGLGEYVGQMVISMMKNQGIKNLNPNGI